jgi:release factor glutamine methyltransferase
MTEPTLRGLAREGAAFLSDRGVADAAFDARQLLLHRFSLDQTAFLLHGDRPVSAAEAAGYRALLERRASGEPLQYILGQWDFCGGPFFVGPGVLIPRPETEQLAEACAEAVKSRCLKVVFDLCAGTGCIGLTVAKACPQATVYLFELYDGAYSYLEKNAAAFGLPNVRLVRADVLQGAPEGLSAPELIVSNPPYIRTEEITGLQREVGFEPATALDGGGDGYVFYRAIAEQWLPMLSKGGFTAVECGEGQPETVKSLFGAHLDCAVVADLYGVPRFVTGTKT